MTNSSWSDPYSLIAFYRSFGYLPAGEWQGDNVVETSDPYVMPRVLREFGEQSPPVAREEGDNEG